MRKKIKEKNIGNPFTSGKDPISGRCHASKMCQLPKQAVREVFSPAANLWSCHILFSIWRVNLLYNIELLCKLWNTKK